MALNNLFSSTIQAVSGVANAINQLGQTTERTVMDNYIETACNPHRFEPDLALNLEICDIINTKGRTYPRDAAMGIVRLINSRNELISSHALELLDICVKNCGYPFHLQIASKEFLNEFVKRFPEKPPMLLPKNQLRILELINHWQVTLLQIDKHKYDFRHIGDMYTLLLSKGYRFPGVASTQVAVLSNDRNILRSADEMEEEDIIVKKAKLQELLRRASPADLEEANKLMKELVGWEGKVDYKAKELEDLTRLEDKAKLLDSLLNNITSSYDLYHKEGIRDMYIECKSAQNKVIKWIETREDDNHLPRLIQVNDILNTVLQRYSAIESGQTIATPSNNNTLLHPEPSTLISLSPTSSPIMNPITTHTFSNNGDTKTNASVNIMDDLLGLSLDNNHHNNEIINLNSFPVLSSASRPLLDNSPTIGAISLGNTTPHKGSSATLQSDTTQFGGMITPSLSATLNNMNEMIHMSKIIQVYDANGLLISTQTNVIKPGNVEVKCIFTNRTLTPITSLKWQIAASKGVNIRLEPFSAQVLPPSIQHGAYNRFYCEFDPTLIAIRDVKIRFRVGFISNGVTIEQEGTFTLISTSLSL